MAALENSDGSIVREAIPAEEGVPARHLSDDEYDALSTRNKERVREAKTDGGAPLYEVRTAKEMAPAPAPATSGEGS